MSDIVTRRTKVRLSKTSMANVFYALIMTKAKLTSSLGIGIYEYDRSQNAYHYVDIAIRIRESEIPKFETLSGVELSTIPELKFNSES